MRVWKASLAAPVALIASQALAENWVQVSTDDDGISTRVDKDSIRRGNDGLLYFNDTSDDGIDQVMASDCQGRILYVLRYDDHVNPRDHPDWRNDGHAVKAGSIGEKELQYVCANAG